MCAALLQQELTRPFVPLAVRVTPACDLWVCFEENVHLCHTWDMVLACTGVFSRAPQVSFCVSEAQPLSQDCRHLRSARCCACAFPGNSVSRTFPFGRRCTRIQDCQSTGASRRHQPEFQSAHRDLHSWLGACLGICFLRDPSVTESSDVPFRAIGATSLSPKGRRVRAWLFLELEKEPDRLKGWLSVRSSCLAQGRGGMLRLAGCREAGQALWGGGWRLPRAGSGRAMPECPAEPEQGLGLWGAPAKGGEYRPGLVPPPKGKGPGEERREERRVGGRTEREGRRRSGAGARADPPRPAAPHLSEQRRLRAGPGPGPSAARPWLGRCRCCSAWPRWAPAAGQGPPPPARPGPPPSRCRTRRTTRRTSSRRYRGGYGNLGVPHPRSGAGHGRAGLSASCGVLADAGGCTCSTEPGAAECRLWAALGDAVCTLSDSGCTLSVLLRDAAHILADAGCANILGGAQ